MVLNLRIRVKLEITTVGFCGSRMTMVTERYPNGHCRLLEKANVLRVEADVLRVWAVWLTKPRIDNGN
jgi:hypothetical protein